MFLIATEYACRLDYGGPYVQRLLDAGADPNETGESPEEIDGIGVTPLMVAAATNQAASIQMLIDAGIQQQLGGIRW